MIAIIEERTDVSGAFITGFRGEGVPSFGVRPDEFGEWIETINPDDIRSIQGFVLSECGAVPKYRNMIRRRSKAPIIYVQDQRNLDSMLDVFAAGVDDVVAKPVHSRELLARIKVITQRAAQVSSEPGGGDIVIFPDGRDPLVDGEPLVLPRRERHILEYLFANRDRRVTRSQIFNAVYGLFDEHVEEQVVESHISKLRKKLRLRLGYVPVNSQRYLGYCLEKRPD